VDGQALFLDGHSAAIEQSICGGGFAPQMRAVLPGYRGRRGSICRLTKKALVKFRNEEAIGCVFLHSIALPLVYI